VGIGQTEGGGFGLVVALDVKIEGLSLKDAEKVVAAGHQGCPYSNAIKGTLMSRLRLWPPSPCCTRAAAGNFVKHQMRAAAW